MAGTMQKSLSRDGVAVCLRWFIDPRQGLPVPVRIEDHQHAEQGAHHHADARRGDPVAQSHHESAQVGDSAQIEIRARP